MFKERGWNKYNVASATKAVDWLIEDVLIENPDFNDIDALTKQIEKEVLKFSRDVENFLSQH